MTIKELNKRLETFEKYDLTENTEYMEMLRIAKVEGLDLRIDKKGFFKIRDTKKNRKKQETIEKIGKRKSVTALKKQYGSIEKIKRKTYIQNFINEFQAENAYMLDDNDLKEFGKKLRSGLKNYYENSEELEKEINELKKKLDDINIVNPFN